MDIFELLKQDHGQLSELLRAIEKSPETERQELFHHMQSELRLHSEAEDRIFYSELVHHERLRESVIEGQEEHRLIEELLEDMATMASSDDQWPAKLTVLIELVSHHVEKEEQALFAEAQAVVDADFASELAERFEEEKENLRSGIPA